MPRYYLAWWLVLPLLAACGSSNSVTLKVGSIPSAAAHTRTPHLRSVPTDALPSSTQFAFAKVDGIQLNLTNLIGVQGGQQQTLAAYSPSKTVTIAPGTDNTIAINDSANIPAGSYTGIKITYNNAYKVKAFCRTANNLVYTTATQIKKVALSTATLPADYDYFAYNFAEVTTALSASGGNNDAQAQTDVNFSVGSDGSVNLAVLFDPSYLVTCFDGSSAVSNGNTMAPFNWGNNNGQALSSFFPDNQPNFGMGYVPIFIWVSTNASEALPTAETYASSRTLAAVNGATVDYNQIAITSFAFKSDGSILDMRSRIASNGGGDLYQFYSAFTLSSNAYGFKNGEWYCDASYQNCRDLQDRAITGFTRTTDFTSYSTATYGDGPDCGTTLLDPNHPEWGNRTRSCLGTTSSIYWRQLVR